MGLSNTNNEAATEQPHKSFGDKIGDYLSQRYPVTSGVGGMVFGENPQEQDNSIVTANAKPQGGGGGLSLLMKLFGA